MSSPRSFVVTLSVIAALTGSLLLAQKAQAADNVGKVVQFQNGGGYTYAEVEVEGGKKVWIAGSQIEVKKGTEVRWGNAMVMRNFDSKALNKRFAEILFVDGWGPKGKQSVATAPHGSYPNPQLGAAPAAAQGTTDSGVVKSVSSAGGYSYIEVVKGAGTVWVAATETPMKAGDKVQWQGGTEMSNFTAKSINRTFPKIIFAQTVTVAK